MTQDKTSPAPIVKDRPLRRRRECQKPNETVVGIDDTVPAPTFSAPLLFFAAGFIESWKNRSGVCVISWATPTVHHRGLSTRRSMHCPAHTWHGERRRKYTCLCKRHNGVYPAGRTATQLWVLTILHCQRRRSPWYILVEERLSWVPLHYATPPNEPS